jgi:ABC-2 type transport system ATP-binding protein
LVATLRGLSRRHFEETASALLNEFALYPNRHSLIASYSKGMRQRIALIAALLHDPDVLILDEPFNGLDVSTTLVVRKVVELLGAARKAIFFSSPVLEEVEKLCSRLLILKKGSVVASGPIGEICTAQARPDLEQAFLQVTDHKDADQVARNILAAVRERGL